MSVTSIIRIPADDSEGLSATLAQWQQEYPGMGVMALLPESQRELLPAIQVVFRRNQVPLVGGIFPAVIEDQRFYTDGVLLFCFERMPAYLLVPELNCAGEALASACEAAAERIEALLPAGADDTSLFMLFDGMLPHIGKILEHLYTELADSVHYMGINAGSETFEPMPCLFDNEQVIGDGMLALLLEAHQGAILEHGYQVPEQLVAATSTEGNRIINIDWQPAFDVYTRIVQSQFGVEINHENFYQYAVHFPFGIIRADSEVLVRIPVALMEDGSLFCIGEIPPNAILTLLNAPTADSTDTVERLVQHLPKTGNEEALLMFYCAGRRLHLGIEAAEVELQQLLERSHSRHLYGALSLGEIGSAHVGGYPLFHNATLVAAGI